MKMTTKISGMAAMLLAATVVSSAGAAVVLNEGYGGGGNSGSTFKNDFIELYNNGLTPVNISGYQVNYASLTGAFTSPTGTDDAFSAVVPAGTTLAVGGFYLIQEAAGTGGTTALPSPNLTDATAINMGGTGFKLSLIDGSGAQLDLVGAGATASTFEGAGPAPAPSNTNSIQRLVNGADSNNNNVDFGVGVPTPGASNVAVSVPEPTSLALIGLAGLGALRRRRA